MKRKNDRPLAGLLMFSAAIGIGLLALLVLAPDYAQAGLNGAKAVSVQSARQADYSADPLGQQRIQPIDLRAVQQALADQADPAQPAAAQATAFYNRLLTPVAMVTPTLPKGGATRSAPSVVPLISATPAQNSTATDWAPTPTKTAEPATPTATRLPATETARPSLSPTRTLARTLAARASATLRVILPSATARPAKTATRISAPATATRVKATLPPYPPPQRTATAIPPAKATATLKAYP